MKYKNTLLVILTVLFVSCGGGGGGGGGAINQIFSIITNDNAVINMMAVGF